MNEPLLSTKFYRPVLRPEFVPRPNLLEPLSSPGKLTLICAPAGFGKTTFVSYWLADQEKTAAWLSLDKTDNDPQRFFLYMIAAINREDSDIGQAALDSLNSSNPPGSTTLLSHLINDLARSSKNFILALDDYHSIKEQQIHDALSFLLDNLPTQLHLVIISRTEPPLPLAKLRARNQLMELDTEALRFKQTEAESFLNQAMDLSLSLEEVTQLENQTEGWITGLQLAALSLKSNPDTTKLIRHIAGNDRHITDYLVSEVLSKLPDNIQQFLLQTSIFGRMNAELCNSTLQISDSQDIIEEIENSNLFIIPLDNKRRWYRYHQLFRKMLQTRLKRQDPDCIDGLHRSAAKWFMDNNILQESIEHSLEAKEYKLVISHLEANIDRILAEGNFSVYLSWIRRIPENHLTPPIALYKLFLLHEMGEFSTFNQQIDFVEKMLGPKPEEITSLDKKTAGYFGILSLIKCIHVSSNFAIEEAATYNREALLYLPEELTFWRILALGAEGFFNHVKGSYSQSISVYSKAAKVAAESNHIFIYFMNSIALVKIYLEYGQLENAINTCRTLLTLNEKQSPKISFAGIAYVMMGRLLYHKAEFESAAEYIKKGIDQVVKDGDAFSIASGYFNLASVYSAQNKSEEAFITISRMKEIIRNLTQSKSIEIVANAYQAYIQIINNRTGEAKFWAARPGYDYLENKKIPDMVSLNYVGVYRSGQKPLKYYANLVRLITARNAIAMGNPREALFTLDNLLIKKEQVLFRAQVLILKSIALQKLDKDTQAVDSLLGAIELVAPEPFFQIFISEGKTLEHLLESAQNKLSSSVRDGESFSGKLKISRFIALLIDKMPSGLSNNKGKRSPFHLTPREIEVLQCLAEGLTYSDSTERLNISMNTFKTHVTRIYSKLDVANSTQAIIKAKELNLLDSTQLP